MGGLTSLIKKKETVKSYFAAGAWSTDELEGYWTGGMVFSMNDWKWVGNRRNLSDFSNWVGRVEGSPCHPHCVNIYGLLLSAPQYKWKAENKGLAYPYISVSDCAIGYIWL